MFSAQILQQEQFVVLLIQQRETVEQAAKLPSWFAREVLPGGGGGSTLQKGGGGVDEELCSFRFCLKEEKL